MDRAVRGEVVKYVDFHVRRWHWRAFEFVDLPITFGGGVDRPGDGS
ncbi:hypothetical protein HQN59_21860 [Schlegelella sp. ID0723]|uniref:Uncharacterized protein n=1 Tax=Piscinibacter koreensis TaxID=2742824 RepID=A0A7Y6TYM8_9BURK|nr:hypothetical protein [Schlegelella koreensis]